LNLPIASYQQGSQVRHGHLSIDQEIKDGRIYPKVTILIEIDLSRLNQIKEMLNLSNLDCFPLTWGYQEFRNQHYLHQFKQRIACKYLAVKLIDRHPYQDFGDLDSDGALDDCNIDMFQIGLQGYKMAIPTSAEYQNSKDLQS
jgi:hypothetical protein